MCPPQREPRQTKQQEARPHRVFAPYLTAVSGRDLARKVDKLGRPAVENGLQVASTKYSDAALPANFADLSQEHLPARGVSAERGVPQRPPRRSEGLDASPLREEYFSVNYEPWSSRIFRSLTE